MQLKSCRGHTLIELLDNLREVASIDNLPFQHGTPLETERETGSGETVLADYESDLEFCPKIFCLRTGFNTRMRTQLKYSALKFISIHHANHASV